MSISNTQSSNTQGSDAQSSDAQSMVPAELTQLLAAFERAFNAGDLGALKGLFCPEALLVVAPGSALPVLAAAAQAPANRLPIAMTLRHAYITGDVALMIIDYVHEGTGPDGKHIRIEGTAADVAQRDPDGAWRCLISNPPGTSRA